MSSLFRSEEMALYQLIVAPDAAYQCISELGDLGCVHFRDLNTETNPFQKKYVNDIKRCANIQQKLRSIEHEIELEKISVQVNSEPIDALKAGQVMELEGSVDRMDEELSEVVTNARSLLKNFYGLKELKFVLESVGQFLSERTYAGMDLMTDVGTTSSQAMDASSSMGTPIHLSHQIIFGFVAGVLARHKMISFETMLWRATRGNVLLRQHRVTESLEDPMTGEQEDKVMFVVYYQGEQLKERVEKTCRGFGANVYPCPKNATEVQELLAGVVTRIEDIRMILDATESHRRNILLAASQKLNIWKTQLLKTKAIYNVLNMLNTDMSKRSLFGECWVPVSEFGVVQMALRRGTEESGSESLAILNRKSTNLTPPTYFKTNKLTAGYLDIIHAYGVADYQEMCPASFTVISFPFLFGVMFGDFGHGLILALIGAFLCIYEDRLSKLVKSSEVLQMLFSGRYIILLMGIFAVYAGLIYNDIFGFSINIFGSSWRVNYDFKYLLNTSIVQLEPSQFNHTANWVQMYNGNPYTFGIDPIWALARNKILFLNSMKMKFSIIAGVAQMIFGIFLNLTNILHFNRRKDILFDFIPAIVFFCSIFFYLVVLIFYKWTHYNGSTDTKWGASCAPTLLVQFINMFLMSYPQSPCSMTTFYNGQQAFQTFLIIIAIFCVPLMLIPKPALEIHRRRKQQNMTHRSIPHDYSESTLVELSAASESIPIGHQRTNEEDNDGEMNAVTQMPTSELLVDRAIVTIEFFLNSISSTASYLRLWALSLAHAQLSEVLWSMVMTLAFHMNTYSIIGIVVFLLFFVWSVATFAILICMEGLSAFLHVLRLHWVEFQTKFYHGDGYSFEPFSFISILRANDLV